MKNLFSLHSWIHILILACVATWTSCSSNKDESAANSIQQQIVGYWCVLEDNEVINIQFRADGTGTERYQSYTNGTWDMEQDEFQYTLSENQLTVMPKGDRAWNAEIAITGNSLSFHQGTEIWMLGRYDGNESHIEALKKQAEDQYIDLEPESHVSKEEIFQSESNLETAISSIYYHTLSYSIDQLKLEKVRLTGKDLQDKVTIPIGSTSSFVSTPWKNAYTNLASIHVVMEVLESSNSLPRLDATQRSAYLNEMKVLRSFLYLNMAQLWGRVVYVSKSIKDPSEAISQPILTKEEVCKRLESELSQQVTVLPEGDYRVDMEMVKALRAEILLELGKREQALELLKDCQSNFSFFIEDYSEWYRLFGNSLPIYTAQKIALLRQEADATLNKKQLVADWKASGLHWGYWMMLKRIGEAQAESNCHQHELLMPFPLNELNINPSLSQNPGY